MKVPDRFTLHLPYSHLPEPGTTAPEIANHDEDRTLRHAPEFTGVEEIGRHDPTGSRAAFMPREYTGSSNLANETTLDSYSVRSEVNLEGTEVHPRNSLPGKHLLRRNARVNLGPTPGLLAREPFTPKNSLTREAGRGGEKAHQVHSSDSTHFLVKS
jgi:hypothetical protein